MAEKKELPKGAKILNFMVFGVKTNERDREEGHISEDGMK